jgi:hypothetical protein
MRKIVCGSLTFALLASACGAQASNLVRNGDFDTDISGWVEFPDAPVFALDTLAGLPDAPALHMAGNQTTDPAATVASACIPVDTTTHFDLRAFSHVDAGAVAIGVFVYSDAACTVAMTLLPTAAVNADQRWHDIELNDFALPDGAHSVQVGLAVGTGTDLTIPGDALFDHVVFGRTGTIDDGIDLGQEGLSGTWYDPETSGQGFELSFETSTSADDAKPLFGTWFTFDLPSDDPASERWYTMQGAPALGATSAGVTIYRNTGGNFDAPPSTTATAVGTGSIKFFSCSSGLLTYAFDDGRKGIVPLHNLLSTAECSETPNGNPEISDYGFSGVYYDPTTSGQGVIVQVDPVDGAVFLGWYTYAIDGSESTESQRWLTAQGGWTVGGDSADVGIFVSTGGGFLTDDDVDTVQVGQGTVTFTSCSSMTFDYTLDSGEFAGLSGTLDLSRLGAEMLSCPLAE